jgi:hypothetical protein
LTDAGMPGDRPPSSIPALKIGRRQISDQRVSVAKRTRSRSSLSESGGRFWEAFPRQLKLAVLRSYSTEFLRSAYQGANPSQSDLTHRHGPAASFDVESQYGDAFIAAINASPVGAPLRQ